VVGTPFAVALPGGGLRLFFCAKPSAERGGMCIGALDSPSGEIAPGAWGPVGKTAVGTKAYLQVGSTRDRICVLDRTWNAAHQPLETRPLTAAPGHARLCTRRAHTHTHTHAHTHTQGMVESPLDFRSDETLDNLTPNLKLLGGATAVSFALVGAFLAANGAL